VSGPESWFTKNQAQLVQALPAVETASALDWNSVLKIRPSSESAVILAREFGVSDALIGKIRRGELYRTRANCCAQPSSDRAGWALAFYT
jgi:hypothetical protein